MKAIILAAGIGSRVKEIGYPKCLIKINGKTIIQKQVESLNDNGIKDISIVTGYRADLIRDECKDLDVKFYENPQFRNTGMLESLYCAKQELNEEFILVYGDIYFESGIIKKLLNAKGKYCLAVVKSNDIEFDNEDVYEEYHGKKIRKGSTKVFIDQGLILKISKKLAKDECSAEYIGVAKFSMEAAKSIYNRIVHLIDSGNISDCPSPSYLFRWLIEKGEKFTPVMINAQHYSEIDYFKDLDEARKKFECPCKGISTTNYTLTSNASVIKGILFDAEDLLYYRDDETIIPILSFFEDNGLRIDCKSFRRAYEKDKLSLYKGTISKDQHLQKVLENLEFKFDKNLFDGFKNVFRSTFSNIKVNKDIAPLFKRLKENSIKIGILTDTFSSEQKKQELFKKIKLDEFIDCINCSSETGFTKDDKDSFLLAAKKLGLLPSEILFVGHQKYEMDGARSAGIRSVSIIEGINEDLYVQNVGHIFKLVHNTNNLGGNKNDNNIPKK